MSEPTLIVATYNVLHGLYADLIIESLKLLREKGASVMCLQEADLPFEPLLNSALRTSGWEGWRAQYVHAGVGGNVAVLWNTKKAHLQDSEAILLPPLRWRAISQRLRGSKNTIRRAGLACTFLIDGKRTRVTSVHMAWEGGVRQRLAHTRYLRDVLMRMPTVDAEIIAGDFNIVPELLRHWQEKKIGAAFGPSWTNALPDIPWTFDIASYTSPEDGLEIVTKICRALGIIFRGRLDYFFVRNMQTVSGEMLDLPGSDHRPLIATFEFKTETA